MMEGMYPAPGMELLWDKVATPHSSCKSCQEWSSLSGGKTTQGQADLGKEQRAKVPSSQGEAWKNVHPCLKEGPSSLR